MFEQIYYYFILPLTFGVGAIGCYFVMDPVKTKHMIGRWSWNASKAYILCRELGTKAAIYLEESEDEDSSVEDSDVSDNDERVKQLIMYDSSCKNNYIGNIPDNKTDCDTLIDSIAPSIILIKTKINKVEYYKRMSSLSTTEITYMPFVETPFIQIEYIVGDEILDIHEHLTGFYVNENKILDKDFLMWYLYNYYSKELSNDYSLRIFDKDVNMFIIKDKEYIQLKDNTYKVEKEGDDIQHECAIEQ